MKAEDLIQIIRDELKSVNQLILNHKFIIDAENGELPLAAFKTFVSQEYYIVYHDARSLALMASGARYYDEFEFFLELSKSDGDALKLLEKMGKSLGLDVLSLKNVKVIPEAVAYTHYLAWLALYGNPGMQAIALIINLPVWGSNCKKLSNALKNKYGINETGFLDLFAQPYGESETKGAKIIERYLDDVEDLKNVSRIIQKYELMFWDAIYKEAYL
ncbi:MAG: TenA family transcriptional regulator [Thermoprotei archaeon]